MPAMIVQNMTILLGKKFGALQPLQLQIANGAWDWFQLRNSTARRGRRHRRLVAPAPRGFDKAGDEYAKLNQ
jgi:hypothetical protein